MEYYTFSYYVLIAIVVYILTLNFLRKFQKCPPCPFPCLPIIGHLYVLRKPVTEAFANLANRYGPVVAIQLGSRLSVVVSSPTAVEECLSKNDVAFCNRPCGFLAGKFLGYDYTSVTWAPYGPHWRNLRRISAVELLSSHRLLSLAGIRGEEVRRLIQRLFRRTSICNKENVGPLHLNAEGTSDHVDVVVMKPLLFNMLINVMTRMLFGKRYDDEERGEEAERFREMVEETTRWFNQVYIGDLVPYLRWLDWRKVRFLKEFKQKRLVFMKKLIEEHKTEINNNNNNNKPLIQVFLGLQEGDPEYYTDDIILGTILEILVGGTVTSRGTMEWSLALLLNNPQILKKAQDEIENTVGHERLIEETDLTNLPYLRSIINETLRMYPPAPLLAPHESSQDCVVQGYRVPKGAILLINLWAIQNDPNLWDDPRSFRPERFDGVEGYKVGYKMMPFGSGRRSCPGEALAVRVVGLAIGSLIQCFDWERVGDQLVDMSTATRFNLHMTQPLQAKIRPRPVMMKLFATNI